MILRQQTALEYPTVLVIVQLSRVHLESFATILARNLTHGTYVAWHETFLVDPSAPDEPTASS